MAAVWQVLSNDTGMLMEKAPIPLWLVLLGSAGIAVGVLTWGWRVMETIGKKITEITPTRGFAAEFGAATTIMIFSMPFLAVPVSTTHTLVGAVVGVGLAGGAKAVDFRVFGKIAASWVASVPVAAFGAATIYVLSGGDNLKMIILLPIAFFAVAFVMWKTQDGEVYVERWMAGWIEARVLTARRLARRSAERRRIEEALRLGAADLSGINAFSLSWGPSPRSFLGAVNKKTKPMRP